MNRDFLQYVGFILTTGLSVILSVLLFTSVADSRLYWLILMGTALAMELGKIVSINDHNRMIAGLLIAVSVLGSAGGLNRAVTLADTGSARDQVQRQVLRARIDQKLETLQQNNENIEFYKARKEIRSMVLPLQAKNEQLLDDLDGLQVQLSAMAPADVPELAAVLQLLATVLAMPLEWVRALVILLLAGLLDALTVSFIRCGVLERFNVVRVGTPEPEPEDRLPLPQVTAEPEQPAAPVMKSAAPAATPANVTAMDDSYPSFRRMMLARRDRGEAVLSQRACIREMNLRDRQVRGFFQRLQSEGIIDKQGGQFEFTRAESRQSSFSII